MLGRLGGFGPVVAVPHCCSEAGTLALSRPDITDAMLHRKRQALAETLAETRGESQRGSQRGAEVLTNCPSCLQGLGRNRPLVRARHLAEVLAERVSGPDWAARFADQAARAAALDF